MRALRLLLLAFLALPSLAFAQDYNSILNMPAGATLVTLSASESADVDQDLLTASLRYEAESADSKKVQDDINEKMTKALAAAKNYSDVEVSTQQYSVYFQDSVVDQNGKQVEKKLWRGQQGLELESKNSESLLKLTGELQALGLLMNGMNYAVSPELYEETRENLLEGAIKKLKTKAERLAKALDKSSADLLEVNVDMGGYAPPVPMMAYARAEGAMAKMDAPVAQPGKTQVTLSVSARALLKP